MKPLVLSAFLFGFGLGCSGLSGNPQVTHSSRNTIQAEQATHWSRKPRVAVIEFENKSGVHSAVRVQRGRVRSGNPIGSGMSDQMVTALAETGAFIIIEREKLRDVMAEQDLGQSGRFKRETTAAIGELEGAELLIYGAVTEYHASEASVGAGIGDDAAGVVGTRSIGRAVNVFAKRAASGFFDQDHVAIDIRLVDARTGRVVNATSVEGKPKDFGAQAGGIFDDVLLVGGAQYSTPLQKAIRACIAKAVDFVAQSAMSQGLLRQSNTPAVAAQPASRGNATLRSAQQQLNGLGFDCGGADGQMGPRTRTCIEAYQSDAGLPATGRLDSATRDRLGLD